MARPPGAINVDVAVPASLARFALVARVDRLGSRSSTARRVGMTDSNFSKHLERLSSTSGGFVTQVDRALAVPVSAASADGLTRAIGHHRFLTERDSPSAERVALTMSLLAQWTDLFPGDRTPLDVPGSLFIGLRRAGPARNGSEVLVRGASLLALLNGFRGLDRSDRLAELERLGDAIPTAIGELLTVASGPVGPAQSVVLAARFGEHGLPHVWEHLTRSPLGYRVMRVIINLLRLIQADGGTEPWDAALRREMLAAINRMLVDLRDHGRPDPYPGRTLAIVAYNSCPRAPEFAWTTDALHQLAWFGGTVRERGHSALALAARNDPGVGRVIAAFRRDDRASVGLAFVADVLEYGSFPPCAPETVAVTDALRRRRDRRIDRGDPTWLPPSVEAAARSLIMVAALDVDSLRRRRACEALNAGLAGPASAEVLADLLALDDPRLALVHQNATLALAFLGQPAACPTLLAVAADGSRDIETRSTALWTVGDLSSLLATADQRDNVAGIAAIADAPVVPVEVQRSAAYALALLRSEPGRLEALAASPDTLAKDLARWGLRRIEAKRRPVVAGQASSVISPLPQA